MTKIQTIGKWLSMWAVCMLAGCGGGGGDAGTPILGGGGGSTNGVTDLSLVMSSATLSNDGLTTVTATVTALNAARNAVASVPVTVAVDSGAVATVSAAVTSAAGVITADIGAGADKTPRTVTVTATAGSIVKTATFNVVAGTSQPEAADLTLVLSATQLPNNGTDRITATVTAVDASRNSLGGIPVSFSVDGTAVASPNGSATDATGAVTALVGIGSDKSNRVITVTATSGTLVKTASFRVVGAKLTGTPVPALLVPGQAGVVNFRLTDVNSNPIVGERIVVRVGSVETSGVTGPAGEYDHSYTAPATTGLLEITASAAGDPESVIVSVQSGAGSIDPANVLVRSASVSANPSVVAINNDGTSNRAEIRAIFVGDGNATVPRIRVRFDLDGDLRAIGGTFTSGNNVVYSDANGVATSAYIPASKSSPTNGLTVRACWDYTDFAVGACPNAARVSLTVISEPLSVSIGTNNAITSEGGDPPTTYVKRFVVQVVDAAGVAKADVQVTPSIDLVRYGKGTYQILGTQWVQVLRASCDNEDLNRNGFLEIYSNGAVEDANQTGTLEPRKADVAISLVGSQRTDAKGQVILQIEYPQNVGSWVTYRILVSASGVSGTEGRAVFQDVLAVPALALTTLTASPPFVNSPYGTQSSPVTLTTNPDGQQGQLCTNPN
jgi:hypothetical protein